MRAFLAHPFFLRALRWIVGATFLYAGLLKFRAPLDFADSIAGFELLPAACINVLALGLPPFEILTGALLLTGWRWRAAALAAFLMTAIFALAMASALARGLQVDCGCFGGGGAPSALHTTFSLGRDLLLFAASAFLYRQGLRQAHPAPSRE